MPKNWPDVVILDVSLPDITGVEVAKVLLKEKPNLSIIALSVHNTPQFIEEMYQVGVRGYCLKDCNLEDLVEGIKKVHNGDNFIPDDVQKVLSSRYVVKLKKEFGQDSRLTEKQNEVLSYIANGKNTKEIAFEMNISSKTVESHRAQIMSRLKIDNLPELTKYAIRNGLTSL